MNSAPAASQASVWEDFVDIFYAPRQVFERRRGAGFGIALLTLVLAIALIYVAAKPVLQPLFDAEFARATATAVQQNPQAAEQIEQGRAFFDKTQYVLVPFGILFSVFGVSVVLWVVVRLFDTNLDFKTTSLIATYSFFPRILEQLSGLVQGYFLSPESLVSRFSLMLSPARFFDPDTTSPILLAVLARFDVFTIWVSILLGIGVAAIGRLDRRKGVYIAVTMWGLGMIPQLLSAIKTASP